MGRAKRIFVIIIVIAIVVIQLLMNSGIAPLKILSDCIKALLITGTVFVLVVDFVGISVLGIDRQRLKERMPSITLFFILLVTVSQVFENSFALNENYKLSQAIDNKLAAKQSEISFLADNKEINRLGIDLIANAKNRMRVAIFGRVPQSTLLRSNYINTLRDRLLASQHNNDNFRYQCVYGYDEKNKKSLFESIEMRKTQYKKDGTESQVDFRWINGVTGMNVLIADNNFVAIGFPSSTGQGFEKVIKIKDNPELAKSISDWYDDLWARSALEPA
jgi:hypothetical protein